MSTYHIIIAKKKAKGTVNKETFWRGTLKEVEKEKIRPDIFKKDSNNAHNRRNSFWRQGTTITQCGPAFFF